MPRENSRTRPSRTRSRPVRLQPLGRGSARIVQSIKLAEQAQIFESRKLFVNADAVAQDADALPGAAGARVFAEDGDAAARGFRQPTQDAQQRGLARAVAAQQRQAGAAIDVEGNVAQRRIVAEILPHAFDAYSAGIRHNSTLRLAGAPAMRMPNSRNTRSETADGASHIRSVPRAVFGKRNHFANGGLARQNHHQAVQAQRDSAVRRRAIFQRLQQKTEALLGFFVRKAERGENLGLHVAAMDTNRARSPAPCRSTPRRTIWRGSAPDRWSACRDLRHAPK